MVYRVIGMMSGSSLDGLDIAYVEFQEQASRWDYKIIGAACYPYPDEWVERLRSAIELPARDYQLLHTEYGHYIGQELNRFINDNDLQYKVALISSHGHTSFHMPARKMTAQLGDGAAIAAVTNLPVVSDLRAMDVALGGQGAPIVPIGEKLLMSEYDLFLNIGGISNISVAGTPPTGGWGFDICAANRVLNLLANLEGREYDNNGERAASGTVHEELLSKLNSLEYYQKPYPKSLANDFGTDIVFPIITGSLPVTTQKGLGDALRTYTEHIAVQVQHAISVCGQQSAAGSLQVPRKRELLVTGGGALNKFLVERIRAQVEGLGVNVVVPDKELVNYKEAMIMAFIGVLRWRQEYNVLSSVTGALKDSIGGALWNGQDA